MTADERPSVPAELDRTGCEALRELEGRDASTLRAAGRYLEELAAWTERRDADDGETRAPADAASVALPDGVPERASVSVTTIGGTEYRYYQWRDGDEIRSETVRR
ncbi:hypothetical protein [Natrinema caseinilyticum]|uniref:hypothetical protein n=1 Tax=Natrinema caseinilyticum TaxID=2961570 RepID=UPI0020C1D447|nr:hypothetical protein [Natrinema caseinilyticum]